MKKPGTANPYDDQPTNFSDYHAGPNDEMHDEEVYINSRVLVIMLFTFLLTKLVAKREIRRD
jgi:hypothetical protein